MSPDIGENHLKSRLVLRLHPAAVHAEENKHDSTGLLVTTENIFQYWLLN